MKYDKKKKRKKNYKMDDREDIFLLYERCKLTPVIEDYSSILGDMKWDVLEERSVCDHNHIVFEIPMSSKVEPARSERWKLKKLDVEKFKLATDNLE